MNKKKVLFIFTLMVISGAIMAYFAESRTIIEGSRAAPFKETTINKKVISLEEYRGKYVLLDFWGSWCGPCHQEAAHLKEAHNQFKNRVQFIGIAVDNNRKSVQQFLENYDITWPQIQVPRNHPIPAKLVSRYEVNGYPTLFLIGPEGNILINGNKESHKLRGKQLKATLTSVLNNEESSE